MMETYPPVSFHYSVSFEGISGKTIDTQFQSVSGLSAYVEVENVREGGENRFTHILPKHAAYTDLVLKRGLAKDSDLIGWFQETFETMNVKPVSVNISLLNEDHLPLVSWNVVHAWPKKWSLSDLDAQQNAIAIETLELNYRTFSIIR